MKSNNQNNNTHIATPSSPFPSLPSPLTTTSYPTPIHRHMQQQEKQYGPSKA